MQANSVDPKVAKPQVEVDESLLSGKESELNEEGDHENPDDPSFFKNYEVVRISAARTSYMSKSAVVLTFQDISQHKV